MDENQSSTQPSKVILKPFQDEFLFSERKFPCLCAGVGTGKTYMLLLKAWQHAEAFPGSVGLIVRNEFTDLRDSTIKDFKRYFHVDIDSNKEYKFPNGSVLLFRHGSELNTLKNMSLSFCAIEQAEEFETDEQFTMLRDRLRHPIGLRQLSVICNARGHNWIWKLWKSAPPSPEYHLITATSFDNESNLVPDFIADLRRMEREQPNHYAQYVMNSFEQMDEDDFVFAFPELLEAQRRTFAPRTGYGHRVMGFDVARFGNDKSAAVGLQQLGALAWTTFHVEQWEKKDGDYTIGRIQSTANEHRVNDSIIDEDGLGAPMLDVIRIGRKREDFRGFRNPTLGMDKDRFFANPRTQAAFRLKEYISKGWIAIPQEELIQELMTLRFKYTNDGRRILVSKDEMRKNGIPSPNMADALLMAVSIMDDVKSGQDRQYVRRESASKEDNLFQLAGVR